MPHANASARSSGTMGSTVNERRIASLNFVSASLSRVLSRNSSSRDVTKLAVPDAGSRRQRSASRRTAGSKAPSAISLSTSARKYAGWCSPGVELDFASDIASEVKSAFQILDQQTVPGVDPGDTTAA